jgi:WD40 repeat protein
MNSAYFSPDGQKIITATNDGSIQLWNSAGKLLNRVKVHQGIVWSANFSADGERILTASSDQTARLFDLSGRQLAEYRGHSDSVNMASFSPDGTRVATASSDDTIRLWRADSLDQLLSQGCDWLKDYFLTHPQDLESLPVCASRGN